MKFNLRPLPLAIGVMALLACVKTAGLVGEISVGSPARASTPTHEAKPPAAPIPAKTVMALTPATPDAAQTPPEPAISDGERNALQDLRARRTLLDTRATKLDEREALLSAAEHRLADRIQQLAALQTKLEQLEKDRHDREEANWRGLVKTYEAMRPRDAATIFNELESPVLIQVLDRMKEAKAAPILAAMTPERARAATTQLAQYRNQVNAAPRVSGPEQVSK